MYFVTHTRIVSALLIREMSTRFGNKPGGYIWALLLFIFQAIAHVPPLWDQLSAVFRRPLYRLSVLSGDFRLC